MGTQKRILLENSIFASKISFCLQKCIFAPKSTFEQNFNFLGSARAKSPKWVRVCEFVRVPKSTFCSKTQFSLNFSFLLQNIILHPKGDFWLKNYFWVKRAIFAILTKIDSIWPLFFHCLVQSAKIIFPMMNFANSNIFTSTSYFFIFHFHRFCMFHRIHHF